MHQKRGDGLRPLQGTRVFFLGDPPDRLDLPWDSSLRLVHEYRRRGCQVHWSTCDDIVIRGRRLRLAGREVAPHERVWIRLDPAAAVRWYEVLRALCHVEARFANPPEAILAMHDGRSALALCPRDSFSLFAEADLGPALDALRADGASRMVLKPPSLSAGRAGHVVADDAAALAAFRALLPLFGYVILEPFLAGTEDGPPPDLRVLITPRRVVGRVERLFIPGAAAPVVRAAAAPTPDQIRLTEAAMALLRRHGIVLAGLDFLGDVLTGINVSCPGALAEIAAGGAPAPAALIVEDIEDIEDGDPSPGTEQRCQKQVFTAISQV